MREEVASNVELLISHKRKTGKSVVLTLRRETLPESLLIGGHSLTVHPFLQKAAQGADSVPVDSLKTTELDCVTLKESVQLVLISLQQLIERL